MCREMTAGEEERTAWRGGGEGEQTNVTFGYARVKGLHDHPIEDYHVARMTSLDGIEIGLFAVFDGHAGTEVASFLEQELFDRILAHPNFKSDPKKTIREIYFSTDKRSVAPHLDIHRSKQQWFQKRTIAGTVFIKHDLNRSQARLRLSMF